MKVITTRMKKGGRLFYIGAGTSGRLGIVDASECPPTYGIEHGKVIGLIAGGDAAIRKAVEFAEDDYSGGWNDLKKFKINKKDVVIGIAASGTTPYVVGALEQCRKKKSLPDVSYVTVLHRLRSKPIIRLKLLQDRNL